MDETLWDHDSKSDTTSLIKQRVTWARSKACNKHEKIKAWGDDVDDCGSS